MISTMNIIETQQLAVRYGRHEAVNGLDLATPQGSVFGLLGPNGAGKTTTIKTLVNLLRPSAGSARILGVDTRKLGPKEFEQIGYVSENQKLPDWMTVRQFLDYCRGFYPRWDSALEETLVKDFELPPRQQLKNLSRGMRMKAALVSSLAYRPRLLILDEPFSGLDPIVRDEFARGVLELATGEGVTVFISSHEIDEIERLIDRVAILDEGRCRLSETLENLQRRFRRVEATLDAGDTVPTDTRPANWSGFEHQGSRATWVDTAFHEGSEAEYRKLLPHATVIARSMTLKETFIAVVRDGQRIRPISREVAA